MPQLKINVFYDLLRILKWKRLRQRGRNGALGKLNQSEKLRAGRPPLKFKRVSKKIPFQDHIREWNIFPLTLFNQLYLERIWRDFSNGSRAKYFAGENNCSWCGVWDLWVCRLFKCTERSNKHNRSTFIQINYLKNCEEWLLCWVMDTRLELSQQSQNRVKWGLQMQLGLISWTLKILRSSF